MKSKRNRKEYLRQYYLNNKDKIEQQKKDWKEKNPTYSRTYVSPNFNRKKFQAQGKVAYALKTGKLIKQPCEVCGELKTEAHHEDYDPPLDVKWLCKKHHEECHHNIN